MEKKQLLSHVLHVPRVTHHRLAIPRIARTPISHLLEGKSVADQKS
jgi:hypothetical protein